MLRCADISLIQIFTRLRVSTDSGRNHSCYEKDNNKMILFRWALCACRKLEAWLLKMRHVEVTIPDGIYTALTPKK